MTLSCFITLFKLQQIAAVDIHNLREIAMQSTVEVDV